MKFTLRNTRHNSALCDVYSKKSYLDGLTINLQSSTIFLNITEFDSSYFCTLVLRKIKSGSSINKGKISLD